MRFMTAVGAVCGLAAGSASAISLADFTDFEGSTTEGWSHGTPSPNPPTLETEGTNGFLRVRSTGGGPGGRMATFNRTQWIGGYLSAGVSALQFDVRNSGDTALQVRIGLLSRVGQIGVTNESFILDVNSGWQTATLDLTDLALLGADNSDQILTDVLEIRFISSVDTSFEGDPIVGSLDIDNIRAVPSPGTLGLFVAGGLAALRRRR